MDLKTHPMKKVYALLPVLILSAYAARAQYCSPTFALGCGLWTNQSVNIGTINWTNSDCTISDYTNLSTTVTAGTTVPMTVVSGNWTGCAVWVDLNNDLTFQDSENLFYSYVGGDPSYTYSFSITIPAGTLTGSYRMRVIAPWGSDGFLDTNVNGYGPCGSFQYGNFDDFTLNVSGSSSIAEAVPTDLVATPNPTSGSLILQGDPNGSVLRVVVRGVDGRTMGVHVRGARIDPLEVDLTALPEGAYTLECVSRSALRTVRVIKQ
jgi:hypothetical protein